MTIDPNHVIETYGYWGIAGIVGLESTGIPLHRKRLRCIVPVDASW
jgi:hypothetical protein